MLFLFPYLIYLFLIVLIHFLHAICINKLFSLETNKKMTKFKNEANFSKYVG